MVDRRDRDVDGGPEGIVGGHGNEIASHGPKIPPRTFVAGSSQHRRSIGGEFGQRVDHGEIEMESSILADGDLVGSRADDGDPVERDDNVAQIAFSDDGEIGTNGGDDAVGSATSECGCRDAPSGFGMIGENVGHRSRFRGLETQPRLARTLGGRPIDRTLGYPLGQPRQRICVGENVWLRIAVVNLVHTGTD